MKNKNKAIRILLVDDEPDILEFIGYNLKKEGYRLYTASDGDMAIEQAFRVNPHLILLDVMMPKQSGIEVCRHLRGYSDFKDVLIAFLSARSEDYSQIEGLNVGGDDYIAKPIRPDVLVSKVEALLRRSKLLEENTNEIRRRNLIINKENYTVKYGDKTIILPPKEFKILYLLASKPKRVFRREEIYDAIWDDGIVVGVRTIDVHMRRLRARTGITNIKTIQGVGYKYED
jgi:two-component system alkaline phosphatase synthesis response regulator PhoP